MVWHSSTSYHLKLICMFQKLLNVNKLCHVYIINTFSVPNISSIHFSQKKIEPHPHYNYFYLSWFACKATVPWRENSSQNLKNEEEISLFNTLANLGQVLARNKHKWRFECRQSQVIQNPSTHLASPFRSWILDHNRCPL